MDNSSFIKLSTGITSDLDLVNKAKRGDSQALNELIDRHSDLINKKVGGFAFAPVPSSVIHAQALKLLKTAVDKYSPSEGANFRTYLESNLRLTRFVNDHKTIARIPEHRSLMIGRYVAAKNLLFADKSREPTSEELAHELKISITDAAKLEEIVNAKTLSSSAMTFDQVSNVSNRFTNAGEFMYFGLTPQEQLVYDYSLGAHGKPALKSVTDIAKKVGITTDKVYQIKRDLGEKIAKVR